MEDNKSGGWNVVPPKKSGKKATVVMKVDIYVEVDETDDWNDMVEQAKEQLRKRVVEGKGFYPFRSRCDTIHDKMTVDELKYRTLVKWSDEW